MDGDAKQAVAVLVAGGNAFLGQGAGGSGKVEAVAFQAIAGRRELRFGHGEFDHGCECIVIRAARADTSRKRAGLKRHKPDAERHRPQRDILALDETMAPPPIPASAASDLDSLSPAMRQHRTAKEAHPDALLFFRMGDFYELFYEDAVVASRELQLTLTARDKARAVPMCGVPYHAAAGYLQKLLRKGFKVALCEQMEDPKLTKNVVRREVTRVLTPGTALDAALDAGASQWLAAVAAAGTGTAACVGVASVDLSTGEMRATEFSGANGWAGALDELERMRPAETLVPRGSDFARLRQRQPTLAVGEAVGQDGAGEEGAPLVVAHGAGVPGFAAGPAGETQGRGTQTELDDWVFGEDYAVPLLRQGLRVHSLDGMGLGGHTAAAAAAGALVHYLRATRQGALEHLDTVRFYERRDCLELDAVSVRNLELVDPLFSGEGTETTLLHAIDACATPMGKRSLRAQLLRPMADLGAINARLDAVALAAGDIRRREGVRRSMGGVLDLERLLGRIALETAGPREVAGLGSTLRCLPALRAAVAEFGAAGRWAVLAELDALPDLEDRIARTLVEEPPAILGDGGAVRGGVDPELDELRALSTDGRQRIAAIEERERERTGIASLKVRFNSVFGYYLEITRSNLKAVPPDYERKQTLVNAERFTTPELKSLETKILTAQERSAEIERRVFADLRRDLLAGAARVRGTARAIAEIDLLACFAHVAAMRGWVRPLVEDGTALEFIHGRHPVVERRLEETGAGRFVPNSLSLCGGPGQGSSGSSDPRAPEPFPSSHHRPEYGRQKHVPAFGGVADHPCAMRFLCAGRAHASGACGSRLYPHRRCRQRSSRTIDLYGRNDGNSFDPQYRDRSIACSAGRNGTRNGDLRRAFAGLGHGRAPSRPDRRAHPVCHALP